MRLVNWHANSGYHRQTPEHVRGKLWLDHSHAIRPHLRTPIRDKAGDMSASKLCFIATLLFAIATIVISGMMGTPPAPVVPMADGFQTPILALEFARTAEDLAFLQGEAAASLRDALMHTQALDRYFPLAYAGMAAVFFLGLALGGRGWAWLAMLLAVLTIPADWLENDVLEHLIHLTATTDEFGDEIDNPLLNMVITTWIKWGLIAAYALMMAVLMLQEKRRLLAIPGALAAIALAATFLSGSSGHVAEIMGLTMLPFMLSFPIAAVMSLIKR